jgi:plasmid maintenance system antidote protein VapI
MAKKKTNASAQARDYFTTYIDRNGGLSVAARALGIPRPTLSSIYYGQKGVGPRTARRMAEVDPMLDEGKLMLVRAVE